MLRYGFQGAAFPERPRISWVEVNGVRFEPRDQHERELAEKEAAISAVTEERDALKATLAYRTQSFEDLTVDYRKMERAGNEAGEINALYLKTNARLVVERDQARAQLAAKRESNAVAAEMLAQQPELVKACMVEAIMPGTGQKLAEKDRLIAELRSETTRLGVVCSDRYKRVESLKRECDTLHNDLAGVRERNEELEQAISGLIGGQAAFKRERDEARAALAKLHEDVAMQGKRLATIVSFVERHFGVVVEWERDVVKLVPRPYTYRATFGDGTSPTNIAAVSGPQMPAPPMPPSGPMPYGNRKP